MFIDRKKIRVKKGLKCTLWFHKSQKEDQMDKRMTQILGNSSVKTAVLIRKKSIPVFYRISEEALRSTLTKLISV